MDITSEKDRRYNLLRLSGRETSKSLENGYVLEFRTCKTIKMCDEIDILGIQGRETSKWIANFNILGY